MTPATCNIIIQDLTPVMDPGDDPGDDPDSMRTIIYIDGFNLYFRLLEKRPALKWLNIKALAKRLLKPENDVIGVRYYTSRVSGRTGAATDLSGRVAHATGNYRAHGRFSVVGEVRGLG